MNSHSSAVVMREDINPLNLLARVAASCSDDDKNDKLETSCIKLVEPRAECKDVVKDDSAIVQSATAELECDAAPQPNVKECPNSDEITVSVEDCPKTSEDSLHQLSFGHSRALTDNKHTDTDSCVDKPQTTLGKDSPRLVTSPTDNDCGASVRIRGVVSTVNRAASRSPTIAKRLSTTNFTNSSRNAPIAVAKDDCADTSNAGKHIIYPSNKPAMTESSFAVVKPPPSESVAQRVTRLLSPNFKLTMTDTMPNVLRNRSFSSLLIGNMGSAAMRNGVTSANPTRIISNSVTLQSRAPSARKYPNIAMNVIPSGYPLLDHDYCYQNYCDIVQAAVKIIKAQNAKKKALAKLEQKVTEVTLNDDGKPVKRKYRTKRVIAEELEAARQATLERQANDGDGQASQALAELEKLNREVKTKRKSVKKKEPVTPPERDSDEEVWNELARDIDDTNPVVDHDPSFKDQFLYFGSKKYKSRSRHLNKKIDPYESFWKTGRLNARSQAAPGSQVMSGHSMDCSVTSNTSQEMNDVLDVLGISPCSDVDSAEHAGLEVPKQYASNGADNDNDDSLADSTASTSVASPVQSALLKSDSCVDESEQREQSIASCGPINTDSVGDVERGEDLVACAHPADDGLDDLLKGITMDQVSELILALNAEPSLSAGTGAISDEVFTPVASEQESSNAGCPSEHRVKSLAALAKEACVANGIGLPDETPISSTQQSQGSNISLDFTEADLFASDRHINLDILNALSATPPKSARPLSLFPTPSSTTQSPRVHGSPSTTTTWSSPAKPTADDPSSQSPVVVPVTMYWNTFPALLVDGVKYVRLIDISRQALPSKETGLLKKRAQSLGYEVSNCTDLQRNLLVKYAFACPSRSNLMVSEAAAAEVIASYMEKSEMEELSKAPDVPCQQLPANVTSTTTTTVRAPAEPVTLMPQVLIEHRPLQQSSNAAVNKIVSTSTAAQVPGRSSRLRQIKSSYRRFLSLGSSTTTPANITPESNNNVPEENASDRGYHSDRSPDSVIERPVHAVKAKKPKEHSRKVKSVRRSLSTTQSVMEDAATLINAEACEEKMGNESDFAPSEAKESPETTPAECAVLATPLPECVPSRSPSTTCLTADAARSLAGENEISVTSSKLGNMMTEPLLDIATKSDIVHIRHVDLASKRSGTHSSQDGELYLQFFKSLHSPCIQCSVCRQFFTLKAFTKHQHSSGRKLVPVKSRQMIEARELSIDSGSWYEFKKQKQLLEAKRSPLKKLSETRLSKPVTPSASAHGQLNKQSLLFGIEPPQLGKRIPKQKKCNPDELYYTNSCIRTTSRKRKAEAELDTSRKRKPSDKLTSLKKRIER